MNVPSLKRATARIALVLTNLICFKNHATESHKYLTGLTNDWAMFVANNYQ